MKKYHIPDLKFPIALKPGLFCLGNYFFNLFLVKGTQKSVLFETGVSAVVNTVVSQLENLGTAPDYIIPAHPHADHITGLPGLMERFPKAAILLCDGARQFVEHPKARQSLLDEDRYLFESLPNHGITPDRPPLDDIPDLSAAHVLSGTTRIDLGGLTLSVEPVFGHAPGNFMAYIPELHTLLSSDSLGFHFPGRTFFPLFFTGLKDYKDTLKRIQSLDPQLICPGHHGPVEKKDIPGAFSLIEASLDEMLDLIYHSRLPEDDIHRILFEKAYVDEFTLYSPENIDNCIRLLIRRAREAKQHEQKQLIQE